MKTATDSPKLAAWLKTHGMRLLWRTEPTDAQPTMPLIEAWIRGDIFSGPGNLQVVLITLRGDGYAIFTSNSTIPNGDSDAYLADASKRLEE